MTRQKEVIPTTKSYKFRIYPTEEQKRKIEKNIGCCRFVFNYFLAERMESYKKNKWFPNLYQQTKTLNRLKNNTPWLAEADGGALQRSLQELDDAYRNFFRLRKEGKKAKLPCFKKKKKSRGAYTSYCQHDSIQVLERAILLPGLGNVKCRVSKRVEGEILRATVKRTSSGKYFVSVNCCNIDPEPLPPTGKAVSVAVGNGDFVAVSDGNKYPNPNHSQKDIQKLRRLQRQLSRKTKGSKNYEKMCLQVARLQEHTANRQQDMLQKMSTEMIRNYEAICIKKTAAKDMMRNRKAACAAGNTSWSEFVRQLKYKANWYGRKVVLSQNT